MGLLIGPTPWWQSLVVSACPVGTTLPDGSRLICKAGGTAWIVAPASTQVSSSWNGTNDTQVGTRCCVCSWSTLQTRLINCGFNPSDWFVPTSTQLQNPGYVCRTTWDSFNGAYYWSSHESGCQQYACAVNFTTGSVEVLNRAKACSYCVRAFRCVTY